MAAKLNDIFAQFAIDTQIDAENAVIENYGDGHINSTFITHTEPKYILQKINVNVFKSPDELMKNIVNVTEHIAKKLVAEGSAPERGTLTVVKARDGKLFYKTEDNEYFRIFKFIDGISHQTIEYPEQFYRAAKTYGKFQKMLSDFDADKLFDIIPNFHNTPWRFENLKAAIEADKCGRLASVKADVDFALSFADKISYITDGIADGRIPLRVTHNDTKLNNFLFDKESDECICAIDLDTVMKGSLLYDYGDALRIGGSSAAEDETDLNKVYFCEGPFEQFTKGFLEELLPVLSERELELLPYSAMLMTYEVGIRFLTDYLEGDVYFHTAYPEHNIDRARNQLKLVADINEKLPKLNEMVKEIIKSIK